MRLGTGQARKRDNRPERHCPRCIRRVAGAVLGVLVLSLMPAAPTAVHAMGERLIVNTFFARCAVLGVQGSFGMVESVYRTDGRCMQFRDENPSGRSTFNNEVVLAEIRWTSESRYEPGTHTVHERIAVGSQILESTMVCPQDPWLTPLSRPCTNITDRLVMDRPQAAFGLLTDEMLQVFRKKQPGIPFTSLIRPDQRAVLIKQYQASRQNLPQSKPPTNAYRINPPAMGAPEPGVADMMAAAPELVSPVAGNQIPQGAVLVKVLRPLRGRADVEFKWLDNAPAHAPYVRTWQPTMDELAAGAVAPASMTDKPGRWEVRVRLSGVSPAPWSKPVSFQVLLQPQQPFVPGVVQKPVPGQATTSNPPALPPQALPGVIQRPPGQDAALNPQPLPPKSMVPGIIMRRGVDEQALSSEQKNVSQEDAPAPKVKP